jgi:hypothetical protein
MDMPSALKIDIYFSYRRNFMLMLAKQSGKINGILKRQLRKQKKRLEALQCEVSSTISYLVKVGKVKK